MLGGGVFVVLLVSTLIVGVIVILVSGRREDDPAGVRTEARYLGAVGYLVLFVAILASFATVRSLADLIVDHPAGPQAAARPGVTFPLPGFTLPGQNAGRGQGSGDFFSRPRSNDTDYRQATTVGLLALVAGGIFVLHYRRRRDLENSGGFSDPGPGRVRRTYFYAVAFTAVLLVLVAVPSAVYGVFRIVAPGVYGDGSGSFVRQVGIAELISDGYLAALAGLVVIQSWQRTGAALPWRTRRGGR